MKKTVLALTLFITAAHARILDYIKPTAKFTVASLCSACVVLKCRFDYRIAHSLLQRWRAGHSIVPNSHLDLYLLTLTISGTVVPSLVGGLALNSGLDDLKEMSNKKSG